MINYTTKNTEHIHIVPVGSADPVESYLGPFKNYPVSKIIFLLGKDSERPDEIRARKIVDTVIGNLPERVIFEFVYSDLFDFMGVVSAMVSIIRKESGDGSSKKSPDDAPEFFINAGSSTRVVTLASYLVASYMPAHVYYAKIGNYSGDAEDTDIEDIIEIPIMPGTMLKGPQVSVLKTIRAAGSFSSLKDLIKDGLKLEYSNGTTRNKYSKAVQSLESLGFVDANRQSSTKKSIELTPSGMIIADVCDIFRFSENDD